MYEDNVWLLGVNMETQGSCHINYTMEKKKFHVWRRKQE